MRSFSDDKDRAGTSTALVSEETIVQIDFRKAVVANVLAMVGRTTSASDTVRTPVSDWKVDEVVFLHLFLGRELRIEQLSRFTYSRFFLLTLGTAYTRIPSLPKLNWIGTYSNRTNNAFG